MARMCPRKPSNDVPSDAERKLFVRMENELTNEWLVLHSVGLARHATKPWSEIDFVLIGPPGIFCLEVKGGRVGRRDGVWSFTDRYGIQHEKQEGPFEQVGKSSSALYAFLKKQLPKVVTAVLGYGCAFPDITFKLEELDVIPQIVYDERDHFHSFENYIHRLAEYWWERLGRTGVLSVIEREQLLKCIRPDFEFRPSLGARAREINTELIRLTQEQYDALDLLADNDRVLIRGGAGTGKTLLAIEEAKRAARSGLKVLYCCFNRLLAREVARLVEGVPGLYVSTLHGLMFELIREASLMHELPDACQEDLLTKFYPDLACQALLQLQESGRYDLFVLDETQDLLLPAFVDVLDLLLKGGFKAGRWRAFYDPKQDLYDKGLGRIRVLAAFQPARGALTVNCRNTQPIAVHTSLLSGFDLQETLHVAGPDVEITFYADRKRQYREIGLAVERVLSEQMPAEEVVILLPHKYLIEDLRTNINLSRPIIDLITSPQTARAVGACTISAFKGLERDVVFLVDLEQLEPPYMSELLYVGASRPRVLLHIYASENTREWFADRAQQLGERLSHADNPVAIDGEQH